MCRDKVNLRVGPAGMNPDSVFRPLSALERRVGVVWSAVDVDPATALLSAAAVAAASGPNARLAVFNPASDVTGALEAAFGIL